MSKNMKSGAVAVVFLALGAFNGWHFHRLYGRAPVAEPQAASVQTDMLGARVERLEKQVNGLLDGERAARAGNVVR